MNIDWIVAIGVFLLFTVWAFAFYGDILTQEEIGIIDSLDIISDKIMENLSVNVHSIPVKVNGSGATEIFYFEYRWPFGKNSTKVLMDGSSQSCNITGNTLYWQSDTSSGDTYFTVKYSEQDSSLLCTGGFAVSGEKQAVPFAIEEDEQVSSSRMNHLSSIEYSVFKDFLDVSIGFNLTIQNSTATLLSYGLKPPRESNVFARSFLRKLEETGENITIRILVW